MHLAEALSELSTSQKCASSWHQPTLYNSNVSFCVIIMSMCHHVKCENKYYPAHAAIYRTIQYIFSDLGRNPAAGCQMMMYQYARINAQSARLNLACDFKVADQTA